MLTDDHRQKQERGRDSRAIISELKSWATRQLVDEEPGSLSIKPIIRKAGVSRGALFRHVPIKNHLIAAAVADFLEGASARLAEHVARLRGSEISISQFGSIPCSSVVVSWRVLARHIHLRNVPDEDFRQHCVQPASRTGIFHKLSRIAQRGGTFSRHV